MGPKFRRKARVINSGIILREMVFKVMRLHEIASGSSVTEMRT